MKTKFNFGPRGGGQIRFAALLITFILVMAYSSVSSQAIDFQGDNLFRSNGYGVTNHTVEVCIKEIDLTPTWDCDDWDVGACSGEIYEGEIEPSDIYYNSLRIYPYSDNDYSDYINGVSTADIVKLVWNRTAYEPFDSPFKFVSGDVDYDHDVDEDDEDMIGDLILSYITSFDRTSWEWFNREELEDNSTAFDSDPYDWTINELHPGGIVFEPLTYLQLANTANHGDWFDLRNTKIGDITGCTYTTINTWVCNSCYTLKGNDEVFSRSESVNLLNKDLIPSSKLSKGSTFDLLISCDFNTSLLGFQIPLTMPSEYFEVLEVIELSDKQIKYNNCNEKNEFNCLWFDKLGIANQFTPNEALFRLKVRVKKDLHNLRSLITTNKLKEIEFVDENAEVIEQKVKLSVENLKPNQFEAYIKFENQHQLEILSSSNNSIHIELFDLQGRIISRDEMDGVIGINHWDIPSNLVVGTYLIRVSMDHGVQIVRNFSH
ncbi:MAG: T9SS type A sorting domain-containing protein [Saprospiraceae bacterium]|nr:T9SS type A sorting domain-containing protein [Saprospiraceae bacterium]HRG69553.1 T9SS type A sorting domain-containing protein [Saprospiraceae bacterium]